MEDVAALVNVLVSIMKFPMEIWGFALSFWDIMISLLVGGLVITWIVGFFND